MDHALVRLLKRKTSLEQDSLSSFLDVEFRNKDGSLDLNLSVYRLEKLTGEPLIRTCAEHTAGNNLNPQTRACLNVAETSGWSLESSPTQNALFNFSFSSDIHHEIKFDNETTLQSFFSQLMPTLQSRHQNVSVQEMTLYAYQKYMLEDVEWKRICELSDKVQKWVMKGQAAS
jgi:hypothetical protein